jgi:hypothetical protein
LISFSSRGKQSTEEKRRRGEEERRRRTVITDPESRSGRKKTAHRTHRIPHENSEKQHY